MKKGYDREKAVQLIPLLRAITREIEERTSAIESLEASAAAMQPPLQTKGHGRRDSFPEQARLADQRRELRLAKQELARLGCTLDQDHPLRVLIPGERGAIESGFTWSLCDAEPKPIPVVSMR